MINTWDCSGKTLKKLLKVALFQKKNHFGSNLQQSWYIILLSTVHKIWRYFGEWYDTFFLEFWGKVKTFLQLESFVKLNQSYKRQLKKLLVLLIHDIELANCIKQMVVPLQNIVSSLPQNQPESVYFKNAILDY